MSNKKQKPKAHKRRKLKLGVDSLHKSREMEQERIILQALYDFLYESKISSDALTTIVTDNLKNAIVPIEAYVDMLLEGHFGDLNDRQKERLQVIKSSTKLSKNILDEMQPDTKKPSYM